MTAHCKFQDEKDVIYFVLGKCEGNKNLIIEDKDFSVSYEGNTYWTSLKNNNGIDKVFKAISLNFNDFTKDFTKKQEKQRLKILFPRQNHLCR